MPLDNLETRIQELGICGKKNAFTDPNKKINHLRGNMKTVLKLILNEKISNDEEYQLIIQSFMTLFDITHRDHMKTITGLSDRRRRSELCMNALRAYKDKFSEKNYTLIMDSLQLIRLENWTKQLQKSYGIIRNSHLKKEQYLNRINDLSVTVLEPREYIGIDPYADSDLDAPSVVTALTPPKYTQPLHSHDKTTEVTFYTGPSEAVYYDDGIEKVISVSYGDMVIIPPGITHTIRNVSDKSVKNISVKLPQALLDRCNELIKQTAKGVDVRKKEKISEGVYTFSLDDLNLGYRIEIREFHTEKIQYIQSQGKTLAYALDGGFIVDFIPKTNEEQIEQNVLAAGDVVICESERGIRIHSIQARGSLYLVTLL